MNILLTGGAGYIGSHAAVKLAQAGHTIVIFDNLCNSSESAIAQIEKITGSPINFIKGDIRNTELLTKVMKRHKVEAVFHFAGLKAVGESVVNPLLYYSNNVWGTISLLEAMQKLQIKTLIFSSSATVYGAPVYLPYDERHPTAPINPYGRSKLQVESLLQDMAKSDSAWRIACLRYFNPVGAHESGFIGDEPRGKPQNLMPYLAQVANGNLKFLNVFGDDYDTKDGTGERDYIHIMDLVEGHVAALSFLEKNSDFHVINLGSGMPVSVLQCVKAFEQSSGKRLPLHFSPRRQGDLPSYYAKADLAKQKLGWATTRSLSEMCQSAWHFQITKSQKA